MFCALRISTTYSRILSSLSSVKIVMKSCNLFDLIRRYIRLYNFSPHFLPFNCYDVFVSSEPNYVLLEFCDSLTVFWMHGFFYYYSFSDIMQCCSISSLLRIVHFFSHFWCIKGVSYIFVYIYSDIQRYFDIFIFIWIICLFGFHKNAYGFVDTVRI